MTQDAVTARSAHIPRRNGVTRGHIVSPQNSGHSPTGCGTRGTQHSRCHLRRASPSLPGPNGGVQRPARPAPLIEPRPRCDAPGAARRRRGGRPVTSAATWWLLRRSAAPPRHMPVENYRRPPGPATGPVSPAPRRPPSGPRAPRRAAPRRPCSGKATDAGPPRIPLPLSRRRGRSRYRSRCPHPARPLRLPRPHGFPRPDRRPRPRNRRSAAPAQPRAPIAVLPLPPGRTEQPMPEVRTLTVPMPPPGPSRRTGWAHGGAAAPRPDSSRYRYR
ncbi:wiskott-Aldrich syndrome protein homolog 1-like [Centrocercus urophasianus]|uniref:wiskott-Aldrich syndrome protein homolog 1-like n=1 Tax=Centrocercus urophasianus TaxID=9002 RepID=UPI001C651AF2|nr:wiskott-Aldrich syndrome protein homolog 1-like [Centrocercus urophasianus]